MASQCSVNVSTFVQVRVGQTASQFLDDVNGLQIAGAAESEHSFYGQISEVIFMMSDQFG